MSAVSGFIVWVIVWGWAGCAINVPALPEQLDEDRSIVMGRAVTVLLGPTTRWYGPHVRFVELINRVTQQRYQVMVESADRHFILDLPPGDYELSRVQISEGPFMSLADLHETFTVLPERVNYVGTWRFGIDIPKYGRKVLVSMIENDAARREAGRRLTDQYPQWADRSIITALPEPIVAESRLYEVAPYPRMTRYFRRHWW
ncbi:MAG: hypothetical protein ABI945_05525 [Nitrospirales bacterium]